MNVARVCKLVPSGLPHEYLGYNKYSLDGMLLSIKLLEKVVAEENEAQQRAADGKSSGASRVAKHFRNI